MNKLSVVIPVYNEKETIKEILNRVRAVNLDKEIIIVDDFSTDGTRDILKELALKGEEKVFFHEKNMGKGAALRTGFEHVTGDYVIVQDADLEYNPEDYHKLLGPVLEGKTEVVYGSRFIGGHKSMSFHHWLGNKFLTFMTNILYNATISDMETCYKLFKTEVIEGIAIKSNRFNFEPEITAKILKQGIRIYEVPISYAGREFSEGKKITWIDGFSALWTLIKFKFKD